MSLANVNGMRKTTSRLYDREGKRGAYLALGVEEYWIVNPEDCSVELRSRAGSEGARSPDLTRG
jgi:Uma2 family endonuclease